MKRHLLSCLLLLVLLGLPAASPAQTDTTRAVWFTTLMGLDWPHTRVRTPADTLRQQQELSAMFDTLQSAGINTILFQARLRGTTAYPSAIEPFDAAFTGTAGRSPDYDPLRFALSEAHRRGMKLQAWVVAFPVNNTASVRALGRRALPRIHPQLCRRAADQYVMDPGEPATATYLATLCAEIASRYAIDGIHLDYIRYPEAALGFNDAATYRRYGQGRDKAAWRRDNVTRVVRTIRAALDNVRPGLTLSCSPVGKYANLPRQSSLGWNARDAVSQDAVMWLNSGIMDELYPMMYFDNEQFYPFALDWQERAQRGKVIPGLGIYFLSPREKDWDVLRIKRQLNFLRAAGFDGFALFRSQFLVDDVKGLRTWLTRAYPDNPLPRLGEALSSQPTPRPSTRRNVAAADTLVLPSSLSLDARHYELRDAQGRRVRQLEPADTLVLRGLKPGNYELRARSKSGADHRLLRFYKPRAANADDDRPCAAKPTIIVF